MGNQNQCKGLIFAKLLFVFGFFGTPLTNNSKGGISYLALGFLFDKAKLWLLGGLITKVHPYSTVPLRKCCSGDTWVISLLPKKVEVLTAFQKQPFKNCAQQPRHRCTRKLTNGTVTLHVARGSWGKILLGTGAHVFNLR